MIIIIRTFWVSFYFIINILKNYQKARITYYNYLFNDKLDFDNIFHFIAFVFVKLKYDILKFWNKEKYDKEINMLIFEALTMEEKKNEKKEEIMYLDLIMEFLSLIKIGIFTAEEVISLLKNKYPDFKDKIDKIQKLMDYDKK